MSFRLVSWNVYGGGHRSRPLDPIRLGDALRALEPDIAALQEVLVPHPPAENLIAALETKSGMTAVLGPTLVRGRARYGNLLLSRHALGGTVLHPLGFPDREPRGAIDVHVDLAGRPLRVVASHFGLDGSERVAQAARLTEVHSPHAVLPGLLLIDTNEWRPWAPTIPLLESAFGPATRHRSWPSRWPLLRLDRIFADRRLEILASGAARSPELVTLSDHLPIWVEVTWAHSDNPPLG